MTLLGPGRLEVLNHGVIEHQASDPEHFRFPTSMKGVAWL